MSEAGIQLRPIAPEKDNRSLTERVGVPWIFDTKIGKGWLVLTSVVTIGLILRIIYTFLKSR